MRGPVSYGFSLLFHYTLGYILGFAVIISGAWCLLNLAGWILFG
jgi:hypothetical protein